MCLCIVDKILMKINAMSTKLVELVRDKKLQRRLSVYLEGLTVDDVKGWSRNDFVSNVAHKDRELMEDCYARHLRPYVEVNIWLDLPNV